MDEQIVTAKTHLKNLTLKHKQAAEHLKKLEVDIEALSKKMTSLDNKRNRTENQKNQARQDTKQYTNQLKNAFNNLSVTYQVYVSPYLPDNDLEWLDTTYPTEIDLEQLNQEVSSRKVHAKSLKKLHQQFNAWNNLDRERQNYRKDLTELEKKNSLAEAPQVRSEKHNLQQIQEKQKLQLQERKQEHSLAKTKLTKASKTVTKLSSDLQQCQVKLRENKGSQKEIQRDLKSRIGSLPEVWQEEANIINIDELKELETQHQDLAKYEKLSKKLNSVGESVTRIKNQISNLRTQIEQLPQEAYRPAKEVERELENAKHQRKELDENRKKAEINHNQLAEQHKRRLQLEKKLQEAERYLHLYKLLSNLLGKEGIQLHILRRAERAIVEIANKILDSLSRRQMRLELRGQEKNSGSQSNKALDLVAYNHDTGKRPTAIVLTSGSQRFRIAVSLALAIGQYAGQGAHRIESVIIDEGFGSLDKNGRDDMIQELNELQQQLTRIILVSHQEEFFSAFTNGYTVELVRGASQVKLMESA
ncbi:MAG: SMC family ATPase [Symploca sp. SIO3C6]|nr:SMC family ATPase [Symploca sp. SIO3C6]